MQLCVDIGNSRVKTGLFNDHELLENDISDKSPEAIINETIKAHPKINALIISSVRKAFNLDSISSAEAMCRLVLNHETPLPIINLYESKESLGNDRIALAVGAVATFPKQACLVFDIGTCMTMELVNEKHEYLGGSISPGIQLRLDAMHNGTSNLPKVPFDHKKSPFLGKNTIECMKSGAVNGMLNEINGAIKDLEAQFKGLRVIISGGDLKLFDKELKSTIFADPNLVLRGLNKILLHNIEKP